MRGDPQLAFIFPNKPNLIHQPRVVLQSIDLARWLVQPKWAGHRALPQCNRAGEITIYSRHGRPLTLASKDNWQWLTMVVDLPRPWLLDGELCRDGSLVIWDVGIVGNKIINDEPYENRLNLLKKITPSARNTQKLEIIQTFNGEDWEKIRQSPSIEGVVWKRRDAKNLWGIHSTKDISSQIKYLF